MAPTIILGNPAVHVCTVDVLCRYGPLARVEIKRNYAFVEYKEVDDAVEAQKRTHGALMGGRTITVEFVESSRERGGRWVLALLLSVQQLCGSAGCEAWL